MINNKSVKKKIYVIRETGSSEVFMWFFSLKEATTALDNLKKNHQGNSNLEIASTILYTGDLNFHRIPINITNN